MPRLAPSRSARNKLLREQLLRAISFASTEPGRENAPLVHVAPQVAGRVLRVHVSDGQPVQAGDLLVEIDPEDFAAALIQATAQAAEALGRLAQARWQLALAEASRTVVAAEFIAVQDRARHTAHEHTAELGLVVAQAALAAAEARINLARAQIETAGAGVVAAQVAAERARIRLAQTEIHAPRTGRVGTRSVEPGDYVRVGQELLVVRSGDLGGPRRCSTGAANDTRDFEGRGWIESWDRSEAREGASSRQILKRHECVFRRPTGPLRPHLHRLRGGPAPVPAASRYRVSWPASRQRWIGPSASCTP